MGMYRFSIFQHSSNTVKARKRQWKTEEIVVPQLAQERPQILQKVHEEMRRDGFRGNREEAQKEYAKRAKALVGAVDLSSQGWAIS